MSIVNKSNDKRGINSGFFLRKMLGTQYGPVGAQFL